ncbi:MAG: M1 family aminopeptidase [Longimicrobiales bacterium]
MAPTRCRSAFFLAAVLTLGCDAPEPPPTDLGVPWELAEHRRRTILEPRYVVELSIPADRAEPIEGRTTLLIGWTDREGHPVVLDFMAPGERVRTVSVNGREVAWTPENDHVVIPGGAFELGTNEIVLEYTAGDEALNRNDDFLYALFVPDRAHFSIPVFDQPNLKGTVEWVVEVPQGWKVVANGPRGESTVSDGRERIRFRATRPLPTYLFAFAAGEFDEDHEVVDGRVLRMFHRETDQEKVDRNREQIFQLHARALEFLEEYTGIPYPFQKFDFVLVPSFQYGGMEHPGSILYRSDGLMLDETATQGQLLGRASLIAHETAHMWFGDLVTMNWFDDVWTKEVFANFMAAKIVQPSFPEVDHELRFLMAHHPSAYGVDRTPGANAIRQPLENLREAGTLYGAIIYQKAPIVMRQLEARVGRDTFRDGLREYLATFSYGNATWPDLIAILDARSDEDLAAWSRVWVEEPGRPRIEVARDGADVVVGQTDPAGRGRVWPQRLEVVLGRGGAVVRETVDLGADPVRLEGAAVGLDFALPNGSGLEYGEFVLDPASRDHLVASTSALADPVVRGAAWVSLYDQVLEARLAPDTFLDAAVAALATEREELILSRLLGYVSSTYWGLLAADERSARAPGLEAAVWAGATGSLPTTARSAFLSSYRGVALTDDGVDRLRRLWAGQESVPGLPLSENDRTALAGALALRGVADAESILDAQEEAIDNPDRAARFRFVRPSLSPDPGVREAFFASLADPANREREPWVLAGLDNLHHPLRAEASVGLIRPALEMLEEVQRTGDIFFPGRWLDATLGGHASPEAADIVQSFLAERPDLPPRLRAKVLQAADGVARSARIIHGWQGEIR